MNCKNTAPVQKPSKIILGIDPGTLLMGYGIITINGSKISMMEMNVLKLSGKQNNHERLQRIHQTIENLILKFNPHEFAIEAPFFGKNVQSMLKLGRAQGVAIAVAINSGIPVTEYSPKKVKQSITGNGNADKEQVWKMLQRLLSIKTAPKHFDATDALAVAVCHCFQSNNVTGTTKKNFKSWDDFIKKNGSRVIP